MKKLVKTLIYSLAVFIGIFGMGQLNVLADDSQTDESSSESVKDNDSTPQQWGDATWYVKDNVLYLGGTEIPDYYTGKVFDMHPILPWLKAGDDEKITKIVINPENGQKLKLPSISYALFATLPELKEIDGLDKLDVSDVTNFSYMFSSDSNLEKVDLSAFTKSNVDTLCMFAGDNELNQITLSGLSLSENSGISGFWIDLNSDTKKPVQSLQGNGKTTTWNLAVDKDKMSSASLDLILFTNKEITMNSDKLNESFTTVDMSDSLKNPDSDDKLFVGIDPESENLEAPTVSKDLFTYVGQTISIDAPVVDGYTANPNVLEITLKLDNKGEYKLETNNSDKSFVTENGEALYTIYYTKNPTKVTPPSTTPTVTSKFTHKLQTLTTYPDQDSANIYDEDGNLSKTVALSPDSNWQTDEYMTIKGEKYYRVATNEFVKASDIYLYKDKDSVVRTHGGTDYISLDNSHGDTVTNRALAVKTDWKVDKVIKINNEDYYRVATNEFVKADNVDVIR